jgi:hypothetical protein
MNPRSHSFKHSGKIKVELFTTSTMNNPKHPFELLQRVATGSQETNKIVTTLPKLEID